MNGLTGVISGVRLPLGAHALSWRLGGPEGAERNGDRVATKSGVVLRESDIEDHAKYLGIYLYPDYTAKFAFSKYMPMNTAHGREIMKCLEKTAGDTEK